MQITRRRVTARPRRNLLFVTGRRLRFDALRIGNFCLFILLRFCYLK